MQDYGKSDLQISVLNGISLHDLGYMGEGMQIAVIDAGFQRADVVESLKWIYNRGGILGTRNFIIPSENVYLLSSHGTSVLSTMAAFLPGEFIGTAPLASYWLLRSEESGSENKLEEAFWVMAAEFADSAGVDIITSSLGYTTFDDSSMNYSLTDLDGQTALITRAAEMAFSKGLMVISSAGNEGNKSWKYISPPADGENVLSVGAIEPGFQIAAFSSRGPTFDGRIKPDIVAIGSRASITGSLGSTVLGYGTSFSAPQVAGLTACLWQAVPEKTNAEILRAIRQSSGQFGHPDSIYGYGVPNFMYALRILKIDQVAVTGQSIIAFPNPFNEKTELDLINIQSVDRISIYSSDGRLIHTMNESHTIGNHIIIDKYLLPEPGLYFILINAGREKFVAKIVRME